MTVTVDAELAKQAVETALSSGADAAEAYASEDARREIRVFGGEVESLTAASQRGVGVRAWVGSRVGYGFGTDLSLDGLAAIVARAVGAARVADQDEFAGPAPPGGTAEGIAGLSDPSVSGWGTAEVVDLALAVERAARQADARIVGAEQTAYVDSAERVGIATSTGIASEFEASTAYAYVSALADGERGQETGLGLEAARGPAGLDPAEIGAEAAQRATEMIGAGKPDSRSCPVILHPVVAASFVGFLGQTLTADTVQRGRSPLAERLGDEIASEALVVYDDGLDPDGLASAPVDGEGVPRRRTALIESGRLRTFLYDTYTARRGGVESTGNADRGGYRTEPSVSTSNLLVATGALSLEDLIAKTGEGIYITEVFGLHSGINPVSGAFSVGAFGRVIRDGGLAEPVREFTIAGDLVSMLGAVRAVGSTARWVPLAGSISTPPLLIDEMTISGS